MKSMRQYGLILVALMIAAGAMVFHKGSHATLMKHADAEAQAQAIAELAGESDYVCGGVLLVNREHPISDDYHVEELVNLYEQPRSFQLASSDILLARTVYKAAEQMFAQANRDGVDGFIITSGYRTAEKQRSIYDADTNGTAAFPGTSEHQTGLALDVTARRDFGGFDDTPQFDWLIEHCWDYGFILRYLDGAEDITGFPYEPWHYRYVGAEVARQIRDAGCTLEEYCENFDDEELSA